MKNKIALIHKKAEEKRALTEAKCGEDLLKAEEIAAKCRATGETPKKLLGWLSLNLHLFDFIHFLKCVLNSYGIILCEYVYVYYYITMLAIIYIASDG
ncbi:putative remorin [Helianthus annuus]|nr:putative remorin [Helianthus annuus]